MRFEDILLQVGGFSRFQFLLYFLLCLPRVILSLNYLLHNFISGMPSHRCAIPHLPDGGAAAEPDTLALHLPQEPDGSLSSCRAYVSPQLHPLSSGNFSNASATVPCQHGWVYNRSQFLSTTATQWDLVCEDKKFNQALATFFFIGVTVGAAIFGNLSDKFGRKPMLLLSFLSSAVLGTVSAFSVSYTMFAVTRTLSGAALVGMAITGMTLSIEWTDIRHRTFTGPIMGLAWSVGNMILALLAYFIRDWRHLMLTVTSPCLAAIVAWWWIPESARWLLVNGKVEKAHEYLLKCAKLNRQNGYSSKFNTEVLKEIVESEVSSKTYSYLDLVKTPKLRKMTICCGIVWFGIAFTYYGISLNITGFGFDMYLTHFLYAAIEVPANVGTYFALDYIGRRNSQAMFLIGAGVLMGINTVIPPEYVAARMSLAVIGKGCMEAAFITAYLYTAELYPTVVRQCGLGYSCCNGQIGSSLAPLVMLLSDVWAFAPPVVFTAVAVLSGCVTFLLSETRNVQLPETIQDVEEERHKRVPENPVAPEFTETSV